MNNKCNEIGRYARQVVLPEIGSEGQRRISEGRVLCIGLGGLGSPAALYLAAAGVGRLTLVDGDTVQLSNLQRQVIYKTKDIGRMKVEAAAEHLRDLNPQIEIVTFNSYLDATLAEEIFDGHDLVVDGTDKFSIRYLINDISVRLDIPYIYGAISGFEGEIATFLASQGPCYRCYRPTSPIHFVPNCAEAGVLGGVAGLVGSAQALEALRHLISNGNQNHPLYPTYGSLKTLGIFSNGGTWEVQKNRDCTTCGSDSFAMRNQKIRKERPSIDMLAHPNPPPKKMGVCGLSNLDVAEVTEVVSTDFILDVREQCEWKAGHPRGAKHWPYSQFLEGQIPDLKYFSEVANTNRRIVVCCRSGGRSILACQMLNEAKIPNVYNLSGGLFSYPEIELELESASENSEIQCSNTFLDQNFS